MMFLFLCVALCVAATKKILLCAADTPESRSDVKSKIDALKLDVNITHIDCAEQTPPLQTLQNYYSVFVWSSLTGFANGTQLGDNLVSKISPN